jgi:putative nucleotidyltransferase-like protein
VSRKAVVAEISTGAENMPLSPEWQVVVTGSKPLLTDAEVYQLRQTLATVPLDWARLTARACAHGVAPLLFHTLQRRGLVDHLPPMARALLASTFYRNAARQTLLARVVQQVVAALQSRGMRVIVLKGAALAETVYPERAVRPMSDIDLLVRPEAVAQVEEGLKALGYTCPDDPRRPHIWWRAHHYHLTWHPPAAAPLAVPLEVHWQLERPSRPFAIDLEGLWARAVPATLAGLATWVLAPEDLLLHLCLHLCKHAGSPYTGARRDLRLRAFCDLAFVLHHHGATLDWEALGERARAWGLASYVAAPLQLTCAWWDVGRPAPGVDLWQPAGVDPRLVGWLRDECLEDPETSPLVPGLLRLWDGHGVAKRLAQLRKVLAPSVVARRAWVAPTAAARYGDYPHRIWSLGRRYGPVLWRLLWQDPALVAQIERKVQLGTWLRPFARPAPPTRPPSGHPS